MFLCPEGGRPASQSSVCADSEWVSRVCVNGHWGNGGEEGSEAKLTLASVRLEKDETHLGPLPLEAGTAELPPVTGEPVEAAVGKVKVGDRASLAAVDNLDDELLAILPGPDLLAANGVVVGVRTVVSAVGEKALIRKSQIEGEVGLRTGRYRRATWRRQRCCHLRRSPCHKRQDRLEKARSITGAAYSVSENYHRSR